MRKPRTIMLVRFEDEHGQPFQLGKYVRASIVRIDVTGLSPLRMADKIKKAQRQFKIDPEVYTAIPVRTLESISAAY